MMKLLMMRYNPVIKPW